MGQDAPSVQQCSVSVPRWRNEFMTIHKIEDTQWAEKFEKFVKTYDDFVLIVHFASAE